MKYLLITLIFLIFTFAFYSNCFAQTEKSSSKTPPTAEYERLEIKEEDIDEIRKINPTLDKTNPQRIYIPKDLEDSFVELKKMLHPKFIEEFKDSDEIASEHFGLGLWMRNNWGLWSNSRLAKYFRELGINHPDDMSSIILSSFKLHLNGKPLEVEKQIAYFKEYWKLVADPPTTTFPGCEAGMNPEHIGSLIDETPEKMPRVFHFGYCLSDEKLWVFEHGKGWYSPDSNLKKKIETPDYSLPELPQSPEIKVVEDPEK